MFGSKTELRVIAVALLAAIAIASPIQPAEAANETYPSTIKFLSDKFVDGKALDGFTPGKPDYGFTLEAMLQRKAAGQKITDQFIAIKATLADSTVLAKSVVNSYIYTPDKKLKPGLAGKFLFTSAVLALPNAPLRNSVIAELKKIIAPNGSLSGVFGNTFDYAWTALGLAANGQPKLANSVAVAMVSLQRPDGGFGTDQTGDTMTSASDATGIALQAFALSRKSATKSQIAIEQKALLAAAAYLRTTQVAGNHWESWGDTDVNGTAYAAMGLKAAGANISAIQDWLKSQLAPSGGLKTPWSNGLGDVFATAQGYAPLVGLSYLNLLPVKK
jgi:hypothetical protein